MGGGLVKWLELDEMMGALAVGVTMRRALNTEIDT
jgi:hypothetical protein